MNIRILLNRLIILSLLFYLLGCNSNAGSGASGATAGTIESRNISASQIVANNDDTPYKGSQAYNSSLYNGENVNGQTGTLTLSQSLISSPGVTKDMDFNLNLVYSSSGAKTSGEFGLPNGWSVGLSKVNGNNSVSIDGSTYLIDPTWSDESGYKSGLKYINNHAIKFTRYEIDEPLTTCHNPNSSANGALVRYMYQGVNGTHQYFANSGDLIARDDKDGNCISFGYLNGKLNKVVDSNGVTYDVAISDDKLTVTSLNSLGDRVIKVSIGRQGVTSYTDANGYVTTYGYDNNGLVNKITSPSLLVTNISYTTLPYTSCSNGGGTLYAVNNLTHNSANKVVLNSTTYKYGVATNGANFTGFGLGGGICLSNKNDGLAETKDPRLKYDVTVIKNGSNNAPSQISRVYYNFMHLPVEQDNLASDAFGDKILSQVNYSYNITPDTCKRSASFSSPIEKDIYQDKVEVEKINTSYDKYNQVTSSTDNILINGKLKPFQNTVTHYFDGDSYYLVSDSTTTDLITQKTKGEKNTLTANSRHIAQSDIFYKDSAWKTLNYGYDNNGRITSSAISWSGSVPPGSATNSHLTDTYSYNKTLLTDTQTDALGNKTITIKDIGLPGSPIVSKEDHNNNITTYTYDKDGRETQEETPLEEVTTISYQVGDSNTVKTTDPLGHATTVTYNALGQVLEVTDNGDNGDKNNRKIQSNTYYPNGSLETTIDKLGNKTTYTYDSLGRQLTVTPDVKILTYRSKNPHLNR
jgi:YD repeat-containing protein